MVKYIRIKAEHSVLILTEEEYLKAIDRENEGFEYGELIEEDDYKLN